MSGHTRSKLLAAICIVAAALTASRAGAENVAPPAGQSTSSGPAPAAAAGTGCSTPETPAIAGGASVVQATGESLLHKNWQPIGGEIQFTVKSFVAIRYDASVFVCFRWKSPGSTFIGTRPSQLALSGDGKLFTVTTTVPDDLGPPPPDVATALPYVVPLAEVRILALNNYRLTPVGSCSRRY